MLSNVDYKWKNGLLITENTITGLKDMSKFKSNNGVLKDEK